jgi:hypothetical protein
VKWNALTVSVVLSFITLDYQFVIRGKLMEALYGACYTSVPCSESGVCQLKCLVVRKVLACCEDFQ